MRPARLAAAGLALLACSIFAIRAASSRPQDPADPVLEAEFVLTEGGHYSQGAAEVRVRGDGSVTVSVHTIGPEPRPPAHVEQYRLSAEERRALASLVRQVDFFAKSDPEPGPGPGEHWFEGVTLRITLDGQSLAREKLHSRAFAPLTKWFHDWIHQTRLLGRLRRDGDVRTVFRQLHPRNERIPQRHAFREPLREFAATTTDVELLTVALAALAPLEDAAPWAELASRRAAALGEDGRLLLLSKLVGGSQWTDKNVGESHRTALLSDAFEAARPRTRRWADLTKEHQNATERLLQFLARRRHEPMFAAIPEIVRESPGDRRAVSLHDLTWWGERGFDAVLALTADPDPAMRRAAASALHGFLLEWAERPGAEHLVSAEERARVRARLLAEGLARLDAMGEDAAEGHDGRRLARGEAKGIRRRSQPAEPVKRDPPGLSIRVVSEDGSTMPGVRVSAVPVARGGGPDRAGRAEVVRKSGADGVALFGELPAGDWEFDVDEPALMRTTVSACRPYREGLSVQLNLRVRKQVTLSGRLVANSGRVLAGAAVRRFRADGTPFGLEDESISDADGRVVLPENRDPGSGRIRVLLPDGRTFLLEERYLTDGRDWVVDFGPAGDGDTPPSVTGRVVAPDGSGLSAFVAAVVADTTGPSLGTTGSRPDGTFEIYGLPPGAYRIWGNYRGRTGTNLGKGVSWWVDVPAVPARDVTLEMPLGERIEGRAVDPSGKPLVGVYLLAERRETARVPHAGGQGSVPARPRGHHSGMASTDREGRFLFENLEAGEYELTAGPGNALWFDRAAAVRTGTLDAIVQARESRPLEGRVAAKDGTALRGVFVSAVRQPGRDHSARATTEEDGSFSIAGTDPESAYALFVQVDVGVSPDESVVVEAGVRGARVEVDVGPVGSVVVKDRFGDPVPRFRLRFAEHSTGRVSERVCDRLGVAHLPYRSAGRWRVERAVPKPGRETVLGTVEAGVPGQVISLPEERD